MNRACGGVSRVCGRRVAHASVISGGTRATRGPWLVRANRWFLGFCICYRVVHIHDAWRLSLASHAATADWLDRRFAEGSQRRAHGRRTRPMPRLHPPDKSAILELQPFAGVEFKNVLLPRSEEQLMAAWADLCTRQFVGFDTESKPTFVAGQESSGPDVVQFATATKAYVLQLRHRACEELARAVLTAGNIVKVGFDLKQDQVQLRRRLGVEAAPVLDLTRVFHRKGYPRELGIKSAVAIVFGKRFVKSKKITTTNWASERLEPRQVIYAANDAYVALRVMEGLGSDDGALKAVLEAGR